MTGGLAARAACRACLRRVPVLPGCWFYVAGAAAWLCFAAAAGAMFLGRWWWFAGLAGGYGLLLAWCAYAWNRRPHWTACDRMWLQDTGMRLPEPQEHWGGLGT